uniref:Putative secreted protein n=1 Tax=Ixodes ricinus TaxID=34613 RepID=A0A6B0U348_IXORI
MRALLLLVCIARHSAFSRFALRWTATFVGEVSRDLGERGSTRSLRWIGLDGVRIPIQSRVERCLVSDADLIVWVASPDSLLD